MTPAAVIDEALTWLGTPYHHGARVKGAGADCGQFPAAVFAACGLIPEQAIEPYPHDWHLHRNDERYLRHVEEYFAPVEKPMPADLALFRYGRAASHGAIVVEWPTIIHAYLNARAVTLDDGVANADLAGRLVGFYRLKEWVAVLGDTGRREPVGSGGDRKVPAAGGSGGESRGGRRPRAGSPLERQVGALGGAQSLPARQVRRDARPMPPRMRRGLAIVPSP